jgi:hypothetical protein
MKGNHVVHTSSYIYISFFFSLIHIIVKTKIALLYFFFHSSDLKYIKWENKRKESWVYEKKEKVFKAYDSRSSMSAAKYCNRHELDVIVDLSRQSGFGFCILGG